MRGSRSRLVSFSVLFYGALAIVAWIWRSVLCDAPLLVAAPGVRLDPLADALGGAVVGGGVVLASRWLVARSRAGRELARRLAAALGPLSGREIVVLALASGIGEELFFRGALQPEVGLVAASLLFGLAHLIPSWPLVLWSAFAVAVGLLFGALYEATGSVLAPSLAHALVNGLNLRWLVQRFPSD